MDSTAGTAINCMRQRDSELTEGWVLIVHTLGVATADGSQLMNYTDIECIFRVVQRLLRSWCLKRQLFLPFL